MRARRKIALVASAIAFGVVTTYATAWVATAFAPIGRERESVTQIIGKDESEDRLHWPWSIPDGHERPDEFCEVGAWGLRARYWGAYPNSVGRFDHRDGLSNVGVPWADPVLSHRPRAFRVMTSSTTVDEVRAGWPLTCLRYWRVSVDNLPHDERNDARGTFTPWRNRVRLPLPTVCIEQALPLRPVWGLFVANVAAWASAFAALCVGPRWLLHAFGVTRRRRRGLCTRCAYDLSGLDPRGGCPECGRAVCLRGEGASAADVSA